MRGEAIPAPPAGFAEAYRRLVRWRLLLVGVMFGGTVMALIVDLATGPSSLGIAEVIAGLLAPEEMGRADRVILWDVRLPYAVMAVVVGASLGLAGAETQTVLNNPLASPFTLGISWAAILGATFVIVLDFDLFGLGQVVTLPLAAFVCAALAGLMILALATRFGSHTETIILFGIALMFGCSALISLLHFVANAEAVQQSIVWSMGTLTRSTWPAVGVVALTLLLMFPFSMRSAWALTLMRAGDEQARGAGIDLHRLRLAALIRTSLLTGAAVAFVGDIGFVGLVAPHIARLIIGEDHRFYLPAATLLGALLLSLASVSSKLIVPGVVLPVGIVTSLVGIPVFVTLIVMRQQVR